jgi:hypothetical protein
MGEVGVFIRPISEAFASKVKVGSIRIDEVVAEISQK